MKAIFFLLRTLFTTGNREKERILVAHNLSATCYRQQREGTYSSEIYYRQQREGTYSSESTTSRPLALPTVVAAVADVAAVAVFLFFARALPCFLAESAAH